MISQSKKNKESERLFRRKLFNLRFEEGESSIQYKTADKDSYFDTWVRPQLSELDAVFEKVCLSDTVVLELGSESGHVAGHIKKKYIPRMSIASDIADSIIRASAKVCDSLDLPRPEVVVLDNYHLPFREKSIDVIVIYAVLHHFPDPPNVMREIRRVLKAGGIVIIMGEPFLPRYLLPLQIFHDRFDKARGISENIFSLGQWLSFLRDFEIMHLWFYPPRIVKRFIPKNSCLCRWLTGGGINFVLKG